MTNEQSTSCTKALKTIAATIAIVNSLVAILSLVLAPYLISVAITIALAAVPALHFAYPTTDKDARGLGRWLGPHAVTFIHVFFYALSFLNALVALRFFAGVELNATLIGSGGGSIDIDKAITCGQSFSSLGPSCEGEGEGSIFANWLARPWALYLHIAGSVVALSVGVPQLARKRGTPTHVALGRLYGMGIYLAGISSIVLSLHTTAGVVASVGFVCLATAWMITMTMGWYTIMHKSDPYRIHKHRRWMLRNFALTFAAVTLRIWLPFLQQFMPFIAAYQPQAWLCWLPNLMVMEVYIRRAGDGAPANSTIAAGTTPASVSKNGQVVKPAGSDDDGAAIDGNNHGQNVHVHVVAAVAGDGGADSSSA